VTLVITNSPGFPEEIGRPSNAPVTHSFDRLAPRQRGTLTLMTELACGNSGGDPARFNQWRGDVAINSSVGTLRGQTANQLTVNIP
jgi:hypothetical protein